MESIRVLIADDHRLFREGIRALLGSLPGIQAVGEAANGAEAVTQAALLQPDVVLMDIQMPGLNSLEATRQILHTSPHIGVLVVSMCQDDGSIFRRHASRGQGLYPQGVGSDRVARGHPGRGEALFSPGIAQRLMGFFVALPPQPRVLPKLTEREPEVLGLIAKGLPNAEIVKQLVVSPKTVRNHISNIFSKLQVISRAEAILRAKEAGLG